jgi:hypothetical protein
MGGHVMREVMRERRRQRLTGFAVMLMLTAFSSAGAAQSSPSAQSNIPNLAGVWNRPGGGDLSRISPTGTEALSSSGGGAEGSGEFDRTPERPPMTAWGKERYDAVRVGLTDYDEQPPDELDHERYCFPRGPTRMFTGGAWPFEIRQMSDVVFMFFERDHWVRRIFMDGRGHPEGYPVTWMGHSIGKYDGDALVVDTVLVNERTWVDGLGHPHSEDAHFVERFRRIRPNRLEYSLRVEDPKAYTRPWDAKKEFELMPGGFEIMEHVICEELLQMSTPESGTSRSPQQVGR